jgi:hypothetical protein
LGDKHEKWGWNLIHDRLSSGGFDPLPHKAGIPNKKPHLKRVRSAANVREYPPNVSKAHSKNLTSVTFF